MSKQHYYMYSATIFFVDVNNAPEEVATAQMFTISTSEKPVFTALDIAKANQALQINLHTKAEGRQLNIVDVQPNAVSYLGEMLPEEFMNTQPVPAPVAPAKPAKPLDPILYPNG